MLVKVCPLEIKFKLMTVYSKAVMEKFTTYIRAITRGNNMFL